MTNENFSLLNFLFEGEVKPLGGDQLIEKIYQDALKWAEENKDKYESAAVNSLTEEKIYEIPIGQSLNLSSPDIANGFVFFNILNVRNNPAILKNFAKNFDYQTRKFKPEFLDQYKNAAQESNMTLKVIFDKLSDNKTKGGAFFVVVSISQWKSFTAKMQIDPIARPNEKIKITIRHELQHGAQNVNSICLAYARKLKDPKITDISTIQEIGNKDSAKGSYGVGSTVTGLRQGDAAQKSVAKYSADPQGDKVMQELLKSLGNDPEWAAYLGDDFEYTTWKSDILDKIINNFVKKYASIINPKINAINTKELGNLFSNPQAYRTYNPQQRNLAQSYIASPERRQLKENLHILSREPTSISDLASLIMKDFLETPSLLTNETSTDYFVKTMMSLKPKEFVRNMTIDLTQRLKNYANEIGAKQASNAEQSTTQQRGAGRSEVSKQQSQQNIQNQQTQQILARQQKQQTAAQQQQLEQQFRKEMNVVPRNPRKHNPANRFDDDTGQGILEPEQYREQFQQWLDSRKTSNQVNESIKKFIKFLFF